MHGSNFGGSKFISSILKNNNIVKAEWDNVEIYNISVDNINAFLYRSHFQKIQILCKKYNQPVSKLMKLVYEPKTKKI